MNRWMTTTYQTYNNMICRRLLSRRLVRRKLSGCSRVLLERLRGQSSSGDVLILGIESSCDDTGVALLHEDGRVLGEAIQSQIHVHQETGGIVPNVAGQLHHENLALVTNAALEKSGCGLEGVSAVAVTIGPGLAPCLKEGLIFAKNLAQRYKKPLIPVHHMEAHALMPRQQMDIPFPFLVLLVSGGHCILGVAEAPGSFCRLGQTRDDSPGEALDKVARWMALHKHGRVPGHLPGGAAIELLARRGNPPEQLKQDLFLDIMTKSRCCDFSFSGLKTGARKVITRIASESGWVESGDKPLPQCEDVAAVFQDAVVKHLLQRTQRALLYCQQTLPQVKHLVVSGGVASNRYLGEKLEQLCRDHSFTLHTPPPPFCTDNGIMIAWAALEHLKWDQGQSTTGSTSDQSPWKQPTPPAKGVIKRRTVELEPLQLMYDGSEMEGLEFRPRWPLGKDVSDSVRQCNIKLPKSNYFKS